MSGVSARSKIIASGRVSTAGVLSANSFGVASVTMIVAGFWTVQFSKARRSASSYQVMVNIATGAADKAVVNNATSTVDEFAVVTFDIANVVAYKAFHFLVVEL